MSRDKQGKKAAETKRRWYENHMEYVKKKSREKSASMKNFIDAVKSYPCEDCGNTFHRCAMQFDHPDPTIKRGTVSSLQKSGSWSRLIEEIMKCDLVCANCHAVRTCSRLDGNFLHLWWNGLHGSLKNCCRKACGFESRQVHHGRLAEWYCSCLENSRP